MRNFALFFALQFITYLNITIDYRAVAKQRYGVVVVTNIFAPLLSWVMIRYVSTAGDSVVGMVAVALGGASSAVLGLWLTKHWE